MQIDSDIASHCSKEFYSSAWFPKETVVVLGSSNKAAEEIFLENIGQIPVFKRAGGGGAVVLHSGCLIVGVGAWVKNYFGNKKYFELLNMSLISTLGKIGDFGLIQQKGISDLAYCDKKIGGTSLFRSKNYLLFQASILVDKKIELLEKLLRHPSKEPDYRQKRSHSDFLIDLKTLNPQHNFTDLAGEVNRILEQEIRRLFADEFCPVDQGHVAHLKKRFET